MQEQKWAIDVPYIDYIFSVIATRRWESSAEQHEEREGCCYRIQRNMWLHIVLYHENFTRAPHHDQTTSTVAFYRRGL